MKKREQLKLLIAFLLAIISFSFNKLQAQTLNFSVSKDTIYENETIVFRNQSSGFNQYTQFKWEFSSCSFWAIGQTHSCYYFTTINDSLQGFINNPFSDSVSVTLFAYDSAGVPLNISSLTKTFKVFYPINYNIWTIDSCHEAFDTCGNLICNGDFSWMSDSVTGPQQVTLAQPWNEFGSADLFSNNHFISQNGIAFSVPNNHIGYQNDHSTTGTFDNYAGFSIANYFTTGSTGYGIKEYLSAEMKAPLKKGQRYLIKMFVSLSNGSTIAGDGIQVFFSDTFYQNYFPPANISNWNDVVDFNYPIITDTSNWVQLVDVYIPQSNNQDVFIVGNMRPDSLLNIDTVCLSCYPTIPNFQIAYYYIDDISVTPLPPELNLTDQYICNPGDTIVLYANAIGDSTLLWSTGSTADSIIVAPLADTFYTITATDYLGCNTITDTVHVYIAPTTAKPNVWLYDAYGCGDIDTVQLSVQGNGAVSYLWNTGDTTSFINVITGTNVQNFSVLVSGAYPPCTDTTLYAQVFNSIAVPTPQITGNINTCDTLLTYHIHNFNPLFQYFWTYDSIGFQTINDSIFTINCDSFPMLYGGDTLVIIAHDTICNQVAFSYFHLLSCCIAPDIELFLNHRDTLNVNYSLYNVSNNRIEFNYLRMSINDTLYIDANTKFYDCDIDMGPYATILFRNGDSLIFENTNIRACDTILWNAVIIPNDSQYLSVKDGIFADAMCVFEIKNGAASYFEGNTFENNYIALSVSNYNPKIPNPMPIGGYTMPNTYNGAFIENSIKGASSTLLYPYNNKRSRSGIELKDVFGFVAGNANNQNQINIFKNLEYGIFGIHSEFEAYYCDFDSINPYTMAAGIWAGGTYCHSGAMCSFMPLSGTIPNPIPPAYVPALTTSVKAHHNTINNSSLGIYGGNSRVDARYNTINAKHNGIVAHEPVFDSHITNNTINVETYLSSNMQTEYTGIGILANNVLKKVSKINISDNTINDPPKTGIWLENLSSTSWLNTNGWRTVIGNNTVTFSTPMSTSNAWKHYGIRISNCDRAIVGFNQVKNQNAMTPYYWDKQKAISVRDCKDARVYSNYPITDMGTGIHIIGNNINTQFYCNSITNSYNGFYFEYGPGVATYISDQGDSSWASDNTWNDGAQTNLRMAGKINLDSITPIPINWNFRGNGGTDGQVFNPQIPMNSLFNLKLFGQPGNTSASICPQPSPNPNDPTGAISYEELRDHYFGEIVRDEIDFEVLAEEFGYFNDEYFYEEMEEYSDWLSLGGWEDTIYQNYYNYLLNSNLGEFDSVLVLMEEGDIDEAINRNNGIVPGNAIETNQKFVDYVYLNYYIKDSLPNVGELQTLEYIALLTPWVGGEAVYSARILLGIDPDKHGIAYRLKKDDDENENARNNIKIYPNPTKDAITIEFLNKQEGKISIKIIDVIGKTVFKDNYNESKSIKVNIKNLKSGMYNILIYINNQYYESKSIIKY